MYIEAKKNDGVPVFRVPHNDSKCSSLCTFGLKSPCREVDHPAGKRTTVSADGGVCVSDVGAVGAPPPVSGKGVPVSSGKGAPLSSGKGAPLSSGKGAPLSSVKGGFLSADAIQREHLQATCSAECCETVKALDNVNREMMCEA